jgi:hypothetical protein
MVADDFRYCYLHVMRYGEVSPWEQLTSTIVPPQNPRSFVAGGLPEDYILEEKVASLSVVTRYCLIQH